MPNEINLNDNYFDNISNNYSASLSNEVVELERKVYIPLLPLEKMSDLVLGAYRYLGEYYWTKDDVYKAKKGNFYIPMMFPMVKYKSDSDDMPVEERETAPDTSYVINDDEKFVTKDYVKRNYVKLVIPRFIILQFSNVIPKGTRFNIACLGGNGRNSSIKITSIARTKPVDAGEFDDSLYETNGMKFDAVVELVKENLKKIREEEKRRKKEEVEWASKEGG